MSEGLILFTNNGDFARKLELPSSNYKRVYKVSIRNSPKQKDIKKINSGLSIDGIYYKKVEVKIDKFEKENTSLIFKMQEGKNREIRKICKYFKWSIIKLIRLQFGPVKLQKEKPGQIKELIPIPKSFLW